MCTFPSMSGDTRDHTFALKRNRAFADLGPQTNLNLRKKASVCCLEVVQPCPARLEIKMESAKQVKTGKRLSSVTRLHIINEEAIEIDIFLSLFLFARAK